MNRDGRVGETAL